MIGDAIYSPTEWEWFKTKLRLDVLETSGPKFVTRYTFASLPNQPLSMNFPEALVECSFWCETTERLLEKRASRSEHLKFYSTWVSSEQRRVGDMVRSFPRPAKEFDFEKHIVYTVLHNYGMGSLAVCNFYGGNFSWKFEPDRIPE